MSKRFKPVSLILLAAAFSSAIPVVAAETNAPTTTSSSQQQAHTLKGTVLDSYGPVIGATVVVKGTTTGTTTDLDGNFELEVKPSDVVEVSYVGYKPQIFTVGNQKTITINLEENTEQLDEVVVTALGMKRDKKALGYAMQELKGDALVDSRESNVANALSGKVSGLQIVRSSNGAGGSSKIVLRGNSSLTGNNQPLIVVDGVPMDNFTGGVDDIWGNSGPDMGSGLSDINPDDIESMSVLKGASAAALYGSRAGNGVILITTKSGKKQDGLGITVTAGVTAETIFMKPDLQNSYAQGSVKQFDPLSNSSWGPKIEGQTVTGWNGLPTQLRAYDNIDSFFRTGTSFNEGISFQQQIDQTSVFASINRSDDMSMVPGSDLNKTAITLRGTTTLGASQKWKLDAKVNYVNTNAHNRPIQGINSSNAFYTIYNLPRSLDVMQFKNPMVDENGNAIWYDTSNSPQINPWWLTEYLQNSDTRNRLLGTMSLKYNITDNWDVEVRGGTDYYTTTKYEKLYAGGDKNNMNGRYSEGSETFYENNFSFLSTYRQDNFWKKFGTNLTFGGNMMMQERKSVNASTGELIIKDVFTLGNGKNFSQSSGLYRKKINSLYGSAQLNWDGYAFLDITMRNDWSSTMSKANRSYFYPSFSFSGVVSDAVEKLGGQMPSWISFAKVRASYAEVGNDLAPYQLYNVYYAEKDPNGNGMLKPGLTLYDSSVRSELVKSWEAGIDVRFLNNRIGVDAAWYRTNATRQLLDIPMDPFSGYQSKKINAGNIQNEGLEVQLTGQIFDNSKGFSWDAAANFSLNRNKIISLAPGIDEYAIRSFDELNVVARAGGFYGDMYGKKFLRVQDKNSPYFGNVIVDGQGLPLFTTDKEYLGNQNPDCMLGITNNFSYKNFSLSFLVDMRFGGKIFSGTTAVLHRNGNAAGTVFNGERNDFVVPNSVVQTENGYAANDNAVTHQNYWQRIAEGSNFGLPELFTYDATNIRLRNITLGYSFTPKQLMKTPFKRLRLSATCNNVWMIHSNLPGIDPESVAATNTNATGFELGAAPTPRSYTFNVTVGF